MQIRFGDRILCFKSVSKCSEQCSVLIEVHQSVCKWSLALFNMSDIPTIAVLKYFWQFGERQIVLQIWELKYVNFIRNARHLLHRSRTIWHFHCRFLCRLFECPQLSVGRPDHMPNWHLQSEWQVFHFQLGNFLVLLRATARSWEANEFRSSTQCRHTLFRAQECLWLSVVLPTWSEKVYCSDDISHNMGKS